MSSFSSALAAFITSLRIEDMSSHVLHKVKLCLLDYLAAAWNAHEHELADAYTRYAFQLAGGTGRAHVIGEQNLLPPIWAAFVNAAKGHIIILVCNYIFKKSKKHLTNNWTCAIMDISK